MGKVVYIGMKNKMCATCARTLQGANPKRHKCEKNWHGSSTSVDQSRIIEGFRKSWRKDGDSSTYRSIVAAAPYGSPRVEKIECRNHILRNYAGKIKETAHKKRVEKVTKNVKNSILLGAVRPRHGVATAIKVRGSEDASLLKKNRVPCSRQGWCTPATGSGRATICAWRPKSD